MKYFISRTGEMPKEKIPVLEVGKTLFTGLESFSNNFSNPTSLEEDILLLASSIFAADRATKRGEREDICRQIELQVPIVNISQFNKILLQLEHVLRLLSNDAWKISLRPFSGNEEDFKIPKSNNGKTLLFSGGLDSFAAAIIEGKANIPLELVSHITRNPHSSSSQKKLVSFLKENNFNICHRQMFVSSKSDVNQGLDHSEDESQRTRSFLFLALGAIVARRTGNYKILLMAENGQMAIHLPLTQGRIGAFSTHTAHPDVLEISQTIFSKLLNFKLKIENPFVELTKKEIVSIINNSIPEAIPYSTSCFRNWTLPAGVTHCGECIPCFSRRIAIESFRNDTTAYARNLWTENINALNEEDEGRRNLMDFLEFIVFFLTSSNEAIISEYPELYSKNINAEETIKMYKRFCKEAIEVFKKYPVMWSLINENIS